MFFDAVLNDKRKKILHLLKKIPQFFYLAGGTGLAIQLGHRISDDFVFFCDNEFDTHALYSTLTHDIFVNEPLKIIQESPNTLHILTKSKIKLSFIRYRYKLIYNTIKTDYFRIASFHDIACMKIIATAQRSTQKDYFDIFFLLKKLTLQEIFKIAEKKYPEFNPIIYLKGLTFFDECDNAFSIADIITQKTKNPKTKK